MPLRWSSVSKEGVRVRCPGLSVEGLIRGVKISRILSLSSCCWTGGPSSRSLGWPDPPTRVEDAGRVGEVDVALLLWY